MTEFEPFGVRSPSNAIENSPRHKAWAIFYGEPTHIILEPFFDDLFTLKDRFEALGMVIKDGKVYLPDLGVFSD